MEIFDKINRLNELNKYYYQCEKVKILEKISELYCEINEKIDSLSTTGQLSDKKKQIDVQFFGDSLIDFQKRLFDYLLETWHTEV